MRKLVKTIKKHMNRIITFVECRLTNAVAEGMNRIINIVEPV